MQQQQQQKKRVVKVQKQIYKYNYRKGRIRPEGEA